MKQASKRGFTLIELLVVIAIIALLLSIMLPALTSIRKQAKSVVCKSNLKQWGIIWSTYGADSGGYFTYEGQPWNHSLQDYYKDPEIRLCPEATKFRKEGAIDPHAAWGPFRLEDDEDHPYQYKGDYGSYGINAWVCRIPSDTSNAGFPQFVKANRAKFWQSMDQKNSEEIPVMADATWVFGFPTDRQKPSEIPNPPPGDLNMDVFSINRHDNRKINVVFMDWSVRDVKLSELWKQKWNKKFDTRRDIDIPGWMKGIE